MATWTPRPASSRPARHLPDAGGEPGPGMGDRPVRADAASPGRARRSTGRRRPGVAAGRDRDLGWVIAARCRSLAALLLALPARVIGIVAEARVSRSTPAASRSGGGRDRLLLLARGGIGAVYAIRGLRARAAGVRAPRDRRVVLCARRSRWLPAQPVSRAAARPAAHVWLAAIGPRAAQLWPLERGRGRRASLLPGSPSRPRAARSACRPMADLMLMVRNGQIGFLLAAVSAFRWSPGRILAVALARCGHRPPWGSTPADRLSPRAHDLMAISPNRAGVLDPDPSATDTWTTHTPRAEAT